MAEARRELPTITKTLTSLEGLLHEIELWIKLYKAGSTPAASDIEPSFRNNIESKLSYPVAEFFEKFLNFNRDLLVFREILNSFVKDSGSKLTSAEKKLIHDYLKELNPIFELFDNLHLIDLVRKSPNKPSDLIGKLNVLCASPEYRQYINTVGNLALMKKDMEAMVNIEPKKWEKLMASFIKENSGIDTKKYTLQMFAALPFQFVTRQDFLLEPIQKLIDKTMEKEKSTDKPGNMDYLTKVKSLADATRTSTKALTGRLNKLQEYQDAMRDDYSYRLRVNLSDGVGVERKLSIMLLPSAMAFSRAPDYEPEKLAYFDKHMHGLVALMSADEQKRFMLTPGLAEALGIEGTELDRVVFNPANFNPENLRDLYANSIPPNPMFLVLRCLAPTKEGFTEQDKLEAYGALAGGCRDGVLGPTEKYQHIFKVIQAAVAFAGSCNDDNIKKQVEKAFIKENYGGYVLYKARRHKDEDIQARMEALGGTALNLLNVPGRGATFSVTSSNPTAVATSAKAGFARKEAWAWPPEDPIGSTGAAASSAHASASEANVTEDYRQALRETLEVFQESEEEHISTDAIEKDLAAAITDLEAELREELESGNITEIFMLQVAIEDFTYEENCVELIQKYGGDKVNAKLEELADRLVQEYRLLQGPNSRV